MLNPNPPRMITVVAAVALVFVGMSATILPLDFVNAALDVVPDLAGVSGETIGAWSLVAAAVVLLLGTLFEGI